MYCRVYEVTPRASNFVHLVILLFYIRNKTTVGVTSDTFEVLKKWVKVSSFRGDLKQPNLSMMKGARIFYFKKASAKTAPILKTVEMRNNIKFDFRKTAIDVRALSPISLFLSPVFLMSPFSCLLFPSRACLLSPACLLSTESYLQSPVSLPPVFLLPPVS